MTDRNYGPGEIIVCRAALGFSQEQLARAMGVSVTAVKRWEAGERDISTGNADVLDALLDRQDRLVKRALAALGSVASEDRNFVIYRDDAHLYAHNPDSPETAASIRAVATRVYFEAPFDVSIVVAP